MCQVGGREDSNVYIRMKLKAAELIGIQASCLKLPRSTSQSELLAKIKELNEDRNTDGIIVQMPLDSSEDIDSHLITNSVDPDKDVDGLCTVNEGKVATGDLKSGFLPCTPYGCLKLIEKSGVEVREGERDSHHNFYFSFAQISGSNAVVIGRSKIVGTPVAELLKWHNATVTVCHSKCVISSVVRSLVSFLFSIPGPPILLSCAGLPTF